MTTPTTRSVGIFASRITALGLQALISQSDKFHCSWIASADLAQKIFEIPVDILIIVLDEDFPTINALQEMDKITREKLLAIIVSERQLSASTIRSFCQVGVQGFCWLPKTEFDTGAFMTGLDAVTLGSPFYDPRIFTINFLAGQNPGEAPRENPLTEREYEIMLLHGDGLSTKDIATKLSLSSNTIRNHKFNLMQKLGIHTTTELVRYAMLLPRSRQRTIAS